MADTNPIPPGARLSALTHELIKAAKGRSLEKSPRKGPPRLLDFAASGALYALAPDAEPIDIHDHLSARLSQLRAMLALVHGDGIQGFARMSIDVQDNFLWACSMLVAECDELVQALPAFGKEERDQAAAE